MQLKSKSQDDHWCHLINFVARIDLDTMLLGSRSESCRRMDVLVAKELYNYQCQALAHFSERIHGKCMPRDAEDIAARIVQGADSFLV